MTLANDFIRKDGFVLFWDSPLSQWYKRAFSLEGRTFSCAEQWMMYSKAKLFGDKDRLELIMVATSPYVMKMVHGRRVSPFGQEVWDAHREQIVYTGNVAKFSQHEDLHDLLLGTGDDIIVEASPKDSIWGVGVGEKDPRCLQPWRWPGLNLLGIALMRVRHHLRTGEEGMRWTFDPAAFSAPAVVPPQPER